MNTQQLATNIKFYRKQYKLTQQELADELKISRSVIAKWENGDVLPDLAVLIKLSHLFHQSIDHLLGLNQHSDQLLSDFQQFYQANTEEESIIDETILDLVDFLVKNPEFKNQLEEISLLPIKQQKAIQRVLTGLVSEIKKI